MQQDDFDDASEVNEDLSNLGSSLDAVGSMASAFDAELRRMQVTLAETGARTGALSSSISRGLRRSFDGLIFDGLQLSDALQNVAASVVKATYLAAIKPVPGHLGDVIAGGIASIGAAVFSKGGSFSQGRVMPFAKGGIVSSPTVFPMRSGVGLMGEAGAEAILPLSRGADGSLGVQSMGAAHGPITVTMNISTPDAASFQRSQSQIAARMSRALARGERNR